MLLKLFFLNSWIAIKGLDFSWEFKSIFSCAKTVVKIVLQSLWQRYRNFSMQLNVPAWTWYYFGILCMLFCLHVHVPDVTLVYKYFCPLLSDLHFSLPCFHRNCFIFSRIKSRQHLNFNGSIFAHFCTLCSAKEAK